jgi:large subunit ribosomal protein L1
VYDDQDIENIGKTGKIEFEVAVATPEMMAKLAKIARVLGPKGLMPNPKSGTVTDKVGDTIAALKKGTIAFKSDDTANVHAVVGRVSFDNEKLRENIETFIDALKRAKPASSKGIFMKSVTLSSSMGPGIKIAL